MATPHLVTPLVGDPSNPTLWIPTTNDSVQIHCAVGTKLYLVLTDVAGGGAVTARMYLSTDDGVTWTEQDAAHAPAEWDGVTPDGRFQPSTTLSLDPDGVTIWVLYPQLNTGYLVFRAFSTATNLWGAETTVTSGTPPFVGSTDHRWAWYAFFFRDNSGVFHVFRQGWELVVDSSNSGKVIEIDITNGGSGYQDGYVQVTISGGGGSGALAVIPIGGVVGGVVTEILIEDNGNSYTSAPAVVISPLPTYPGSGATATATISNGSNYGRPIYQTYDPSTHVWSAAQTFGNRAGLTLNSAPTAMIQDASGIIHCFLVESDLVPIAAGPVTNIVMTDNGSGYTSASATVSGDGSGCVVTPHVNALGIVDYVIINNFGSGYTTATINIAGDGTGAAGTCVIGNVWGNQIWHQGIAANGSLGTLQLTTSDLSETPQYNGNAVIFDGKVMLGYARQVSAWRAALWSEMSHWSAVVGASNQLNPTWTVSEASYYNPIQAEGDVNQNTGGAMASSASGVYAIWETPLAFSIYGKWWDGTQWKGQSNTFPTRNRAVVNWLVPSVNGAVHGALTGMRIIGSPNGFSVIYQDTSYRQGVFTALAVGLWHVLEPVPTF